MENIGTVASSATNIEDNSNSSLNTQRSICSRAHILIREGEYTKHGVWRTKPVSMKKKDRSVGLHAFK